MPVIMILVILKHASFFPILAHYLVNMIVGHRIVSVNKFRL